MMLTWYAYDITYFEHEINICKCKINAKCLANIEWCSAEAVDNVQYLHDHHDDHHQTISNGVETADVFSFADNRKFSVYCGDNRSLVIGLGVGSTNK
jgi:hypothetical protein